MAAAREAFASGDLGTAVARSEAARATWASAADVGVRRWLTIGGAVLLVSLVGLLVAFAVIRRRAEAAIFHPRPAQHIVVMPMAHRIDKRTSRGNES
jgi:hypothetical protein